MEESIAKGEGLHRYIPQRPPMVMIDALLRYDASGTESSFQVPEEGLFIEKGVLSAGGLVENIAQSAAAGVGYHYVERTERGEPPLGFIAAVKDMSFHQFPASGQQLRTSIQVKQEVMNMTIVEGKVWKEQELVAEGELRIFLQEEG